MAAGSFTVYRGRGAEYDAAHFRALHCLDQRKLTGNVVIVIAQRILRGLADRLQTSEVDDCRDLVRRKHGVECLGVANVALDECNPAPGDALYALDHRKAAVRQVVEYDHLVTGREQFDTSVRTDVASAAGDEDFHDLWHATAMPVRRGAQQVALEYFIVLIQPDCPE